MIEAHLDHESDKFQFHQKKNQMRLKIWHVVSLCVITALFCCYLELAFLKRAEVEIQSHYDLSQAPNANNFYYVFEIRKQGSQQTTCGCIYGRYGYNHFFNREITAENAHQFIGNTYSVQYRDSLLWNSKIDPVDVLSSHFDGLAIIPDADEWKEDVKPLSKATILKNASLETGFQVSTN